jgi:hypothetical protein
VNTATPHPEHVAKQCGAREWQTLKENPMKLNRWAATAVLSTALTAALIAGGTVAASAAPPEPEDAPNSSNCQFGGRLEAVWKYLPADLRGDLTTLKDLPAGTERANQARAIRDQALGGDYGPRLQERAAQAQERRVRVVAGFPAQLRADLNELEAAAPEDRRELATEISDTALEGGYGSKAKFFVERVQASDAWQNCVAP